MWIIAFLILNVLLLLFPPTRFAVAWVLALIVGPASVWLRYKVRDENPAIAVEDRASVPAAVASGLARRAAELSELGFQPRGLWTLDAGDRATKVRAELLEHVESGAIGMVSVIESGGMNARETTAITRQCAWGEQTVTDSAQFRRSPPPNCERAELPSLTRAEWLWEAHRAMVARAGALAAIPTPKSPEEWGAWLTAGNQKWIVEWRRHGWLSRPNRRGLCRYALRGCCRITIEGLWPWRQRLHRAALRRERETLQDLGLEKLLEIAELAPGTQGRAQAAAAPAGMTIPDDRGVPRTIARADAIRTDERRFDRRFCAVVSQSQAVRLGRYRHRGVSLSVAFILIVIPVAIVFRIPIWIFAALFLLVIALIAAASNPGRYFGAERAAAGKLLRHGLCPVCLYAMGGLAVEADGCMTCPECGGAWKRDRVGEFTAFSNKTDDDPGARAQLSRISSMVRRGRGTRARGGAAKDDRREECVLVAPRLQDEIEASPDGGGGPFATRARLLAARDAIQRSGRLGRIVTASVACILVGSMGAALVVMYMRATGMSFSVAVILLGSEVVAGLALVLMAVLGAFLGGSGYSKKSIIREMLARGLCPACAEDTSSRLPGADGCVECACGAAWRVTPPLAPSEQKQASNATPEPS